MGRVPSPPSPFSRGWGPSQALVPPSVTVREGYLLKRKEEPAGLYTALPSRATSGSAGGCPYSKSPEWQVGLQPVVEGLHSGLLTEVPLCTQGDTEAQEGQGLAQGPKAA